MPDASAERVDVQLPDRRKHVKRAVMWGFILGVVLVVALVLGSAMPEFMLLALFGIPLVTAWAMVVFLEQYLEDLEIVVEPAD